MKVLWLPLLVLLWGCGRGEVPAPFTSVDGGAGPSVADQRTFVIVPTESKVSYHANEEFFAGALKLLGINAGNVPVVGTTQAIEGRFRLDPEHLAAGFGDNAFAVRLDTLISNQKKRDEYIREIRDDGGPSFDAYPSATFNATAVDLRSSGADLHAQLTGDLTIRETTKRVVFDVTGRLVSDTLSGVATSRFLLSDFGIGPIEFASVLSVADEVRIEVEFVARAERR